MSILDTLKSWFGLRPSVHETLAKEEEKILKDPNHPKYRDTLNARLARDDKNDD